MTMSKNFSYSAEIWNLEKKIGWFLKKNLLKKCTFNLKWQCIFVILIYIAATL